ncbi:B-4DMT family transporter [Gordonia shandongensis]|uniref:B-4DMT family transporter n=1 Tax=Gordonia shandongensis TaxID=376351 RepID=UPI00047ADA14|nr:B-4DMT family transporter [Gordonia shandongensis]
MSSWLLRGTVMSIVHIAARIILSIAVVTAPLSSPIWRWLAIIAVVLVAMIWGGVDGIKDARENADPDDYADLTVRWLKVGVMAGLISCLVSWILGVWSPVSWLNGIGQADFLIEILAGGSFITLVVYVPAFFGVTFGRFLIRREQRKAEQQGEADEAATQQIAPV